MSGRFARENVDRGGYAEQLTGLREALKSADASVPTTAQDLAELERLVPLYPEHTRQLLAALPEP